MQLLSKTSLLLAALVATGSAAVACKSSAPTEGACEAVDEDGEPVLPDDLSCTGLYANFEAKEIDPANREFAPASPLWSDGAGKRRWIQLPEGTKVDATEMDDWKFPVGTKAWKEFSVDGVKVETRFLWKVREDRWLQAAYVWSEDGTSATRDEGAELTIKGKPYQVPSTSDCNSCHEGRKDKLLGFEALNLAFPGATGLTLAGLAEEDKIAPKPEQTKLEVPDDGTGKAGAALAYMHTNCGVSCHSVNDSAIGGRVGLRLRLRWDDVAGKKSISEWDAFRTTVGVESKGADWEGKPRITPGDPKESLLVDLVETRGPGQMPKLGTAVVDDQGVAAIKAWVSALSSDGAPKDPKDPTDPDPRNPDPGTPNPSGSTCLADSVAEAEANDTPETGNPIPGATGTFCGSFSSASDVDYVTFTAPADFAGLSMKLTASNTGASATVSVDGAAPSTLGQGPVPAVRNGNYVVRIAGPADVKYRLTLTIRK